MRTLLLAVGVWGSMLHETPMFFQSPSEPERLMIRVPRQLMQEYASRLARQPYASQSRIASGLGAPVVPFCPF